VLAVQDPGKTVFQLPVYCVDPRDVGYRIQRAIYEEERMKDAERFPFRGLLEKNGQVEKDIFQKERSR
jgi:hypothetical protein